MGQVFSFDHYKIFYYVATCGSMNRAAETIGMVPSSISKAIQLLESELDSQLFVRTTKGIKLTPEGKTLFEKIEPAVSLLQSAEQELKSLRSLEKGRVHIGFSGELIPISFVFSILKKFRRKYPGIRVQISTLNRLEGISALRQGNLDFFVTNISRVQAVDLEKKKLYDDKDRIVVGKDLMFLTQAPITLKELAQYPLIFSSVGCEEEETVYRSIYQSKGLTFEPEIITPVIGTQVNTIVAGLGYSFVPTHSAEWLVKGELFDVTVSDMETVTRPVGILISRQIPISYAAQELIRVMEEEFLPD